jgi:hypothetical protein
MAHRAVFLQLVMSLHAGQRPTQTHIFRCRNL